MFLFLITFGLLVEIVLALVPVAFFYEITKGKNSRDKVSGFQFHPRLGLECLGKHPFLLQKKKKYNVGTRTRKTDLLFHLLFLFPYTFFC